MRYNTIKRNLEQERLELGEKISDEKIKAVLTQPMPDGLFCPYYEDGMGTLWSILFYPAQRKIQICFGSIIIGKWRTFDFCSESEMELHKYITTLISESAPEGFWDNIN